jgi:hypothetical protein
MIVKYRLSIYRNRFGAIEGCCNRAHVDWENAVR